MRATALVSLTRRAIDFAAALSSTFRNRSLKKSNVQHNSRGVSLRYVAAPDKRSAVAFGDPGWHRGYTATH